MPGSINITGAALKVPVLCSAGCRHRHTCRRLGSRQWPRSFEPVGRGLRLRIYAGVSS
ncbi:hypothetical protein [Kamptonema formosum]|uniref:hypothetical protein n=1 Tax=Kamptonema formosum TaxID=331992 RepID=UPI0012DE30EC|nr:hypothetical protein [Oscillatoria sp. PCC 10802]